MKFISFAKLSARTCGDADIHWKWRGENASNAELQRSAYIAHERAHGELRHRSGSAVLLADRYGGTGVGHCGGSARCATLGDIQIKGVGLTPLHGTRPGSEPDSLHSSGIIHLLDAGHEAIMSSVCGAVLPHGSVPALALLSTGTLAKSAYAKPGDVPSVPRVLLLRRFAWRPAHFLRNLRFRPSPELMLADDGARVAAAMRMLPDIFEGELGVSRDGINEGLIAMAGRFARQLAAAHAKRLFHGGLSPSNIALDGRYLDFGTTTAVPAYRRRVGAPKPGGADIWGQSAYIEATLSTLQQHLERYLPLPPGYKLISEMELIQEFRCEHEEHLSIEFAKLSGIPEKALLSMPRELIDNAYRCMRTIALRGSRRYIWKEWKDEFFDQLTPLSSIGHHDLSEALRAYGEAGLDAPVQVDTVLSDTKLAEALTACLDALYAAYMQQSAVQAQQILRVSALRRCVRLNGEIDFLVRETIHEELLEFERDLTGVGEFIDCTIAKAVHMLSDSSEDDFRHSPSLLQACITT